MQPNSTSSPSSSSKSEPVKLPEPPAHLRAQESLDRRTEARDLLASPDFRRWREAVLELAEAELSVLLDPLSLPATVEEARIKLMVYRDLCGVKLKDRFLQREGVDSPTDSVDDEVGSYTPRDLGPEEP